LALSETPDAAWQASGSL